MADDGIEHVYVFATSAYASFSGCRQYHEDIARARVSYGGRPHRREAAALLRRSGLRAGQRRRARRGARLAAGGGARHRPAGRDGAQHPRRDGGGRRAATGGAYEAELHGGRAPGRRRRRRRAGRSTWSGRAAAVRRPCPGSSRTSTTTCGRSPTDGETAVVVFPVGFVSDHLEVIWDLDNEARETAEELGLAFARAATAGTHPAFVASVVDAAGGAPGRGSAAAGHELPGGLLLSSVGLGRHRGDGRSAG